MDNEYVLLNNPEEKPKLYNYKSDPSLKNNLAEINPQRVTELNRKLLAYLQSTTEAITDNKVYREETR